MPETNRQKEPSGQQPAEQTPEAASEESVSLFSRTEPKSDEVSYDDVRRFLDHPYSLPVDKIDSLIENFGHIGEVASRLINRHDFPPEAISDICQLHGHEPEFAYCLMKNKGQLTDDDNRQLYQNHRQDRTLTVNHIHYQRLPQDCLQEIYNDHQKDRYILLEIIRRQPDMGPDLIRQFYGDHHQKPEFVSALVASQKLPPDIAGRAFDLYQRWPEFVALFCQHQKDLDGDLANQVYKSYDRSFRPILDDNPAPPDFFGPQVADALKSTLPGGGAVIDLNTGIRLRVGQWASGPEDAPGSVCDQAYREYQGFLSLTLNLLINNQLNQETIGLIYDELGGVLSVVKALFESQQSIPPDTIKRACRDHESNIGFVKILFKNQNDLPRDVIESVYQKHRWNQLFDGSWLAEQTNLTEEEREEARSWRPVYDPKDEFQKQERRFGAITLKTSRGFEIFKPISSGRAEPRRPNSE